jgi:hypothetical protein
MAPGKGRVEEHSGEGPGLRTREGVRGREQGCYGQARRDGRVRAFRVLDDRGACGSQAQGSIQWRRQGRWRVLRRSRPGPPRAGRFWRPSARRPPSTSRRRPAGPRWQPRGRHGGTKRARPFRAGPWSRGQAGTASGTASRAAGSQCEHPRGQRTRCRCRGSRPVSGISRTRACGVTGARRPGGARASRPRPGPAPGDAGSEWPGQPGQPGR